MRPIKNINGKMRTRIVFNNIFKILVLVISGSTAIPLIFIIYYLTVKGIGVINWDFFISLPVGPGQEGGGIANSLVGTIILILVSTLIAFPFGLIVGIYLSENKIGRLSNITRFSIELLQGIPSIVVGILAWIWFVKPFNGFSALSGSFALAILMIPVIAKSTEETLKLVPHALREASLSLGVPVSKTIIRVFLPTAASGIITGLLLAVARVAGETAPLLFTAFGSPYMNYDLTRPIASLPSIIFNYAGSPYESWQNTAWGASFVLIVFVFILNILAKIIGKRWKQQY